MAKKPERPMPYKPRERCKEWFEINQVTPEFVWYKEFVSLRLEYEDKDNPRYMGLVYRQAWGRTKENRFVFTELHPERRQP